jgi:hypothetical protein
MKKSYHSIDDAASEVSASLPMLIPGAFAAAVAMISPPQKTGRGVIPRFARKLAHR